MCHFSLDIRKNTRMTMDMHVSYRQSTPFCRELSALSNRMKTKVTMPEISMILIKITRPPHTTVYQRLITVNGNTIFYAFRMLRST